jgi:hypothetical protein
LLITSFINNITLSNHTIVSNGPTPEDQALNYLIYKDTTFKNSQLLTLNSTMTNIVQFRIRQRYALLTLWFQPTFTNTRWYYRWLLSANECDWQGFSCSSINLGGTVGTQNVVTAFDSNNIAFWVWNDMKGTIPADLGLLTAMEIFNVNSRALTGTLPASIIQWTALLSFGVPSNFLTGTLPASIGQWTALTYFAAYRNELTGTIPASIGSWSQIQYAYFDGNQFTGTMPNGICPYIVKANGEQLEADCVSEINCTCCTSCF